MARRSKQGAGAVRRQAEAAVKLLIVGAAFTLLPLFLGNSTFGRAFAALTPVGLLMIAAGSLFLWLRRRRTGSVPGSVQADPSAPRHRSAWDPAAPSPPSVDRTVTELERHASTPRSPWSDRTARPTTWTAGVFAVIEWRRFEALVEDLFRQGGFQTKSQSHGPDSGVDVWLYSRNQPGTPVSIVQCKHWYGRRVGVDKIRELRGVMAAHGVRRGQFATTATFTRDAVAFARANAINLLDLDALLGLIAQRTPQQQQALLRVALEGDYWRPTCVNCGVKMLERTHRRDGNAFWGCINYPRCKTKMWGRTIGPAAIRHPST